MRITSLIAVAAVTLVVLSGAGSGMAEREPTTEPPVEPHSDHPCGPGSGCLMPVMMGTDGGFHFEEDVHMEDGTNLTMENGSTLRVREQATLLIPAEAPRLFSGGTATLGTADKNTLRLVVDNKTGLRLVPADTPNVIGGNASNVVGQSVTGATIGGGGTGNAPNEVLADFGTVSGGRNNVVSGPQAIVLGGEDNTASGEGSLAAGRAASAAHDGSFVWSDSNPTGITSSGPDQFIVDAAGGVGIGTSSPASALSVEGNITPATNATYALGSPDLRWTDVWLSSVIHHDGDLVFENTAGETTSTLSQSGDLVVSGTLSADALEGDASNLTGVEADTLAESSVNSTAIADEEVQTADLANASVTASKIGEACAQDQVLKVNSTGAWVCAEDADTTYDGSDFALSDQACASGDVVAGMDANGNVLCVTDQDTDSDTLAELDCASTEITRYDGTAWVCSTDQDTTYTASTPIDLSGTDFTLSSADCTTGDHWVWNGSAWNCVQSGDVTAVSAGTGLTGGGTSGDVSLAVDTSAIQQRVTGSCGADESIEAINSDGTVSCEVDDDTTYVGGTGITITNTTIANDLGTSIESDEITDATIQRADLAQDGCSDAEVLKWDAGNSLWSCAADKDTQTSTIPWTDVTDKPAGFADDVDNDTLEGLACASGEIAKRDGSTWTCAVDEDSGGDITAVSAGTGLTGGGTSGAVSLDVNTSAIQQRVTGICNAGAAMRVIDQNGTVTCEVDDDTTYTAGDGLDLSGTTFQLDQSCASDEFLRWTGTSWACSTESGDISSVRSGTGLTGGGTSGDVSLAVDTTAIQERVSDTCGTDSSIDVVNSDGTVSCEVDDDTTYTAGDGMELNSGAFEIRQDCASLQVLKVHSDTKDWVCRNDRDTTYSAGDGLNLSGETFELLPGCDFGQIPKVTETSTGHMWACGTDRDTTYTAGDGLELDTFEDTFKLRQDCSTDQLLLYNGTDWRCSGQTPDADLLDGRDSSQFLRSDISDTYTGGSLTFLSGGNDGFDLETNSFDDTVIRRDATDDDTDWFRVYSGGNEQMRLENGDEADAEFDGAVNANGLDLAELYEPTEPVEAGDVVALDPTRPGAIQKTTTAADRDAIGVVSTDPGLVLSPHGVATEEDIAKDLGPQTYEDYLAQKPEIVAELVAENPNLTPSDRGDDRLDSMAVDAYLEDHYAAVALAGRVPVEASAENGPIEPGDRLAAGSTPGVAVKATGSGHTIGTALEALPAGTGEVTLFVDPGWHGEDPAQLAERVEELEQENQRLEERLTQLEQTVEGHLDQHES